MPQLLLELFSEEIPARMQAAAARDLERLFGERLKAADLTPESLRAYSGPRRLTLVAEGLPVAQADRNEEFKGPRVGSPDQAIEGFLRKTGVTRADLEERDGLYFASVARKGRPTPEIVAEAVEAVVRDFPWPKSMTWGTGRLRWVRPLKRILCLFDGAVVPLDIDGLKSGALTEGHRFMGSGQALPVSDFASYSKALADNRVVLDAAQRKLTILTRATELCAAKGLELVDDPGLLDEVAGLSEWPTPVLGDMDPAFLDLPAEVIRTSMRTHQKYFAVRDPKTGGLAPHFVTVANIEANDGGVAIAKGNARVLSARLNDARFFWDEDNKPGNFDRWLEKLKGVTFHAKLGTMAERVERITALAREIAPLVGADPNQAAEAARLAKADLASGMVGEFPELQGVMGGYYGRAAGLQPAVWEAVRDHYKPQGPGDIIPTKSTSVAVGLADKFDALVGFFFAGERPTGSRDPYALRRAVLGITRTILASGSRVPLKSLLARTHFIVWSSTGNAVARAALSKVGEIREYLDLEGGGPTLSEATLRKLGISVPLDEFISSQDKIVEELLAYFADRLKVILREEGRRHDLVDAVFALGDDDLVRIVARVEALDGFLNTDDGANLLSGIKRAVNILKSEGKKYPDESYDGPVESELAREPEELRLATTLAVIVSTVKPHLAREDFTGAMSSLAALRGPVDAFFEKVLVNDPVPAVRLNRLRLLSQIRDAANRVADFSLISG